MKLVEEREEENANEPVLKLDDLLDQQLGSSGRSASGSQHDDECGLGILVADGNTENGHQNPVVAVPIEQLTGGCVKAVDEPIIGAGREGREDATSLKGRKKCRCIGEEARRPAGEKAIASSALLDNNGVLSVHDGWLFN